MISPWANHCAVDRTPMSFDAYNRFIEDDFLGGQHIDGATDGRPDPRATVQPVPRETALPGDLSQDFDWSRTSFPTPPAYPLAVPTPGNVYATPTADWCGANN